MLKKQFQKNLIEAGCDEVGRGCIAGPVVAAAVILPTEYFNNSIIDSKKLSPNKREEVGKEIIGNAIAWSVSEVSNNTIDKINILNASFLAMHRAIDQISNKYELLLIDGNRFNKYKKVEHKCIIKGDAKYMSIAAASVIAKTARDKIMKDLSEEFPQYSWETNQGYPTKKHRESIKKFGANKYHRKSFCLLANQIELF